MSKKTLKEVASRKRKLMSFAANDEEKAAIQAKADKYAGGNLSLWLRKAAVSFTPNSSDLL